MKYTWNQIILDVRVPSSMTAFLSSCLFKLATFDWLQYLASQIQNSNVELLLDFGSSNLI